MFQSIRLQTSYTGPVHSIDIRKKGVRNNTSYSLQLTESIVEKYRQTYDVTEKEKQAGFNSKIRVDYKVTKLGMKSAPPGGAGKMFVFDGSGNSC